MTDVHVTPRDDLIEHDEREDCVCYPTPIFVTGGILYQHHSLDGRERVE